MSKLDTKYLIKRGNIWWVTKRIAGKKTSASLRTRDHSEAIERRDNWLQKHKDMEILEDSVTIKRKDYSTILYCIDLYLSLYEIGDPFDTRPMIAMKIRHELEEAMKK